MNQQENSSNRQRPEPAATNLDADRTLSERAAKLLDAYPWSILAPPTAAFALIAELQRQAELATGADPTLIGHSAYTERTQGARNAHAHRTLCAHIANAKRTQSVVQHG